MSTKKLITIAIGPVQDFIASARKLRDLWYGSHLLSELSKCVARSLQEQHCELIFPAIDAVKDLAADSDLNVANKILAVTPEGANAEEVINKAKKDFNDFWKERCCMVKKELPAETIKDELFEKQIADFGEFYGAWIELDENDYPKSRSKVDKLLAGRKSLREFNAPGWEGSGLKKSSLDGMRESVIRKHNLLVRKYLLKKGEELDALGLIKRGGPLVNSLKPNFDSLSEVAVLPYLYGLKKDASNWQKLTSLEVPESNLPRSRNGFDLPTNLNLELLLPARLEEFQKANSLEDDANWQLVRRKLRDLYQVTAEPQPYACLLVGDGDRMGKTLEKIKDKSIHQSFSRELDKFARQVKDTIAGHHGKVIYSGGDDVMAYLPLHTAVKCAAEVNRLFGQVMGESCKTVDLPTPTFSAGLVVVHHLMPLYQALELARKAERIAKDRGRDRLVVIQSKRSGSDKIVCGKWQSTDGLDGLPGRLALMCKLYREKKLPSRLAYQLGTFAKELPKKQPGVQSELLIWKTVNDELIPDDWSAAEVLRIVDRKRQADGELMNPRDKKELLSGRNVLQDLVYELILAQQIAVAQNMEDAFWCNRQGEGL